MTAPTPPPVGPDWKTWARQFTTYIRRQLPQLFFKDAGSVPSENGILLWDNVNGYPVVSKNNEFRQVVLSDGYGHLYLTSDVTAAVADTAYALTYSSVSGSGVSFGSPTSRIVFEEGGEYLINFSAQVASTSSSTVDFYFWPRLNGTDVANETMKISLHQNNATLVASRSSIFTVADSGYLEVMYAFSDATHGKLEHTAATSFAPATPASTLSITRVHG